VDLIYVDNNATTRLAPEVLAAMRPHLEGAYGNPSSLHQLGAEASAALDEARARVAAFLGASPSEITFTSGGTESNNLALLSALATRGGKNHLVTSAVEHPSILNLCEHLEKRQGVRVTRVGVAAGGTVAAEAIGRAIDEQTALVSVMAANNETGVRLPLEQIAKVCEQRKVPLHTDAVQAAGKVPLDVSQLPVHFLSISAHKFHGPKGIGALYVRKGTRFSPLIRGGNQERKRRAGTENVPAIVGLGRAVELAQEFLEEETTRVAGLRDRLEQGILDACPQAQVNGGGAPRVPNTTNISFAYVDAEAILISLDREGICASSGSACSSGSPEPSHVLRAMQVPYTHARGSIRFSLSRYNTAAEIERLIAVVPRIVAKLRAVAPFKTVESARQR
jgi:cysteine desulfurase